MIKKAKEYTEVRVKEVFIAEDGREFTTEEECKRYEESASFAIKLMLIKSKCLIYLPTGYQEKTTGALYYGLETMFGCHEDYDFYLFCPKTKEDIKLFTQWVKIETHNGLEVTWQKRTKENNPRLAERLLTDDSEKWESYRQYTGISELEPGKKYIYSYLDGYGNIAETEQLKKVTVNVVDSIVEQFAK